MQNDNLEAPYQRETERVNIINSNIIKMPSSSYTNVVNQECCLSARIWVIINYEQPRRKI